MTASSDLAIRLLGMGMWTHGVGIETASREKSRSRTSRTPPAAPARWTLLHHPSLAATLCHPQPIRALPPSSLLCSHPTLARTLPTASESESFNLLPSALALSTCTCLDCEDHNCTTEQSAFNSTGCPLKRSGIYIGWRHRPQRLTTSKPSAPTLGPRG